jgi:toxin YoeB
MYNLQFTTKAEKEIALLKKNGGETLTRKLEQLLIELIEHPKIGTGRPEQLKGAVNDQWSRRIDKKNRLVYTIEETIVTVIIISAKGHYDDK